MNLGVDDVVDFAMNELRTKDLEHYIALESSSMRLQTSAPAVEVKVIEAEGREADGE